MVEHEEVRNALLAATKPGDFERLSKHLIRRSAPARDVVVEAGQVIDHLYFPESGLVSFVAPGQTNIEVGMVGREGVVGTAVLLGVECTPLRAVSQIRGDGFVIAASVVLDLFERSPPFRALLSRFLHVQMMQSASTSFANANLTMERRLCRWLLMVRDRLDADQIELTHETIATMLNVRRPGLTVATHILEGRGLIRARRGLITILDHRGLAELAGASYGLAEREYERLLPAERPAPVQRREAAPIAATG